MNVLQECYNELERTKEFNQEVQYITIISSHMLEIAKEMVKG